MCACVSGSGYVWQVWMGLGTNLVHHSLLVILTRPIQAHQDGLDVVCDVVFKVIEKSVQQLGGLVDQSDGGK